MDCNNCEFYIEWETETEFGNECRLTGDCYFCKKRDCNLTNNIIIYTENLYNIARLGAR